ncbi:hypothetical protein AB0M39_02410 [Streptomyces sp. NPDC051907]|uniref:hypothetical protein n=1 Tax=Streptomyces sp. NPDC051907 TaxID=3155284 RepID=UPI0034337B73
MYREFAVPDDLTIFEALGEWPEEIDEDIRQLTLRENEGGSLVLSYAPLGRSVRIIWKNSDGRTTLDLFREGATRLNVTIEPPASGLTIDFHMGGCAGELSIQILPALCVTERLLFV